MIKIEETMLLKFLLGAFLLVLTMPFCRSDPVMEMINSEHYPAEKHTVTTKDGYYLSIYRIPNLNKQKNNRKVILFMHGMTSAAPAFLTFGRNQSAAYKFSDAGYDVWIGNARGNTYSKRHMTLSPNDPRFWQFSWHEIGVMDLPATIDYILYHTNQTKLSYVGHSQGVTAMFAMLSDLPEYNEKISVFHAMTPPVVLKHNHPLTLRNMDTVNAIAQWFESSGRFEVAAHKDMEFFNAIAYFCMQPTGRPVCRSVVYIMFGPSGLYFDELFHTIINHIPAGASYRQLVHYAQISAAQRFQHYHYGSPEKNMKVYGTPEPPPYNLRNVRTNVHIMHGTNDWLTPSINVPLLANALGRYPIAISKFPGYNHIDFAYGSNLDMVHRKILKVQKIFYQ